MTNTIAIVLAALIRVESGGDATAVGDGGRAVARPADVALRGRRGQQAGGAATLDAR